VKAQLPAPASQSIPATVWVDVCGLGDLVPERGVAALVGHHQVAIFRVPSDGAPADGASDNGDSDAELFALSNFDPFSKAFVMSRGIVGTRGDTLKVASPVYKQSFDLRTGGCLDDPDVSLPTFDVRTVDGRVQVALPT